MKSICRFYILLLAGGFITGCDNNQKPAPAAPPVVKAPEMMEPFRFHKLIEVSPGEDYDILSWGRGSATVGSFEILHSDSAAKRYVTTTGDLDGAIVDAYNSDMDLDGNPEILIQAKGKDTNNYVTMYAFEFTNGKAQKLDFPKLNIAQRQGYRGEDNFYIKDGILMREFPIYDGKGKDAKPTGQKRLLQYGLRDNSFTVKQLSKDSVSVAKVKPTGSSATKSHTSGSTKKSEEKPKKHTEEKKHKKKKHRRHHESDDE